MHHDARRTVNRESGSVHDAVVRLDKLDTESAQIDGLSVLDHLSLHPVQKLVLPQLVLDQPYGQLRGVNRHIDLFEHIGKRTDMILMSMGNNKALHLLNIFLQIGDVRDNKIDAQHVILREGKSAVHDNNTVLEFKGSNVHSDLLQSAQRNDPQF